jgi:hypothetical protein
MHKHGTKKKALKKYTAKNKKATWNNKKMTKI